MKTKNIFFILVFTFGALVLLTGCSVNFMGCSEEAQICPDGTAVVRQISNGCEFPSCPELQSCDVRTKCPESMSCYKFPDSDNPYCHFGDPCSKCSSGSCRILKSFPAKVVCD